MTISSKVLEDIKKKFGADSIIQIDDVLQDVDVISTHSLNLDRALGVGGIPKARVSEIYGKEGSGKAQPLDCKVLTPEGWTTIGELEIGSVVYSQDGTKTSVIGIFPQGKLDTYKVKFSDKSETRCCEDHLWTVQCISDYYKNNYETLSLKEIIENGLTQKIKTLQYKYRIPQNEIIDFDTKNLSIEPYLLGLLIGDGCLRDTTIKLTTADSEILESFENIVYQYYPECNVAKVGNTKYEYRVSKNIKGHGRTKLRQQLEELNLADKLSQNKHIPKEYLLSDRFQRTELLQGLMDSDGTVDKNGMGLLFSTSSPQLAEDFLFLTRSLGIRAKMSTKKTSYKLSNEIKSELDAYQINLLIDNEILPFKLTRKLDRYLKRPKTKYFAKHIVDIEKLAEKQDSVCIMVDHPDQLYITDDFIVTHNTTLCTHLVAEAQKQGDLCAYIDMENAVSLENFETLGVDIRNNFLLCQPNSGDEALAIVESLLESKEVGLIVVDSVASLIPQAELDGELQDSTIGLQARLMSKFMRRTSSLIRKSNCALVFINQLRANIGGYGAQPATTTTGGNALKYYASVRIDIARTGSIKEGEQIIGQTVKAKIVKNKVASPFKDCEFYLIYGEGISNEREILELSVKNGIIKKGGAWYTYGENKWQGLEKARAFLKDNPKIKDELYEQLK